MQSAARLPPAVPLIRNSWRCSDENSRNNPPRDQTGATLINNSKKVLFCNLLLDLLLAASRLVDLQQLAIFSRGLNYKKIRERLTWKSRLVDRQEQQTTMFATRATHWIFLSCVFS